MRIEIEKHTRRGGNLRLALLVLVMTIGFVAPLRAEQTPAIRLYKDTADHLIVFTDSDVQTFAERADAVRFILMNEKTVRKILEVRNVSLSGRLTFVKPKKN